MKPTREHLIEKPNCGLKCPKGKFCCDGCASSKGSYEEKEREQFSGDKNKLIDSLWNNTNGWLGSGGCRLPRRLRSYYCLWFNCHAIKRSK